MDANGVELPTWYEMDGSVLRQVVDAANAKAPVLFDPTYSFMSCLGHFSDLSAPEYLDMYGPSTDYGVCSVHGLFFARNDYLPVWAFETNVANDYGLIPVKQAGDCSVGSATGISFDFQLPCRAHDYCYDLRKAGFSGTVTDSGCDSAFLNLMRAHCNNRVFSGDCNTTADIYYLAVRLPNVVTEPDPALVYIQNRANLKCADVEGPSSLNGTPIQQWSCVGVANQIFRVWPAPGAAGLFQVRPVWIAGKCVRAAVFNVTQNTCIDSLQSERFRIQGALNQDQYSIRNQLDSFVDCWHVPSNSGTNGTNLIDPVCNDFSNWYIWRFFGA